MTTSNRPDRDRPPYDRSRRDPWAASALPGEREPEAADRGGVEDTPGAGTTAQPEEAGAGTEAWRLFVAADLPEPVTTALGSVRGRVFRDLARNVRWSPAEGIHLTLQFLGDVDPTRVDEIGERVRDAADRTGRFHLRLGDPGAFPSLQRPRVLWIGVEGETERLRRLQVRLAGSLERIGFAPEERPFHPHLTLGRVRSEAYPRDVERLGRAFASVGLPAPRPEFNVTEIVLVRSHLRPGGAAYERVHAAPLG